MLSAAVFAAAPPRAGASQMRGCDFSGTALMNAMVWPSGDQRGELSPSAWSEIFVSGPPLASITHTSVFCPSSNALPVRSETNAMRRPSGDHCGSASFHSSPEVSCVAWPDAASTTQMCARLSSNQPVSLNL